MQVIDFLRHRRQSVLYIMYCFNGPLIIEDVANIY